MKMIPNRQTICDVLCERAREDRDIVVLCSDSRGSASMSEFFKQFPAQSVEVGIAEQNLVSVAAGLASCGKKPFVFSPSCFLSTRSIEQIKVDVAYSGVNVKLIGISGGVSYGALGMSHHSAQDIAMTTSLPGMRTYLPCDSHSTRKLLEALLEDHKPAFVRVGRNGVPQVYEENSPFVMDRAGLLRQGTDAAILACGELVSPALEAAGLLAAQGIQCRELDMYSLKPLDGEAVLAAARETGLVVTVEEHGLTGGLGSLVCRLLSTQAPARALCLGLPDEAAICGSQTQVLAHYGLDAKGIAGQIKQALS